MIEIRIKNPGSMPAEELQALCEYLLSRHTETKRPHINPEFSDEEEEILNQVMQPSTETVEDVLTHIPADSNPEVDSEGLPWDVRIHSSSHAKTADGRWRARRNLDKTMAEQVSVSLRETMAIAPEPAPTDDTQTVSYGDLAPFLSNCIVGGHTTNEAVMAALQQVDIQLYTDLEHRPDLIQKLLAILGLTP